MEAQTNYNWLSLRGDRHITDERYQELMAEEGVFILDEYLHTPEINESYLAIDPEKNQAYLNKLYAANGLLEVNNG